MAKPHRTPRPPPPPGPCLEADLSTAVRSAMLPVRGPPVVDQPIEARHAHAQVARRLIRHDNLTGAWQRE
eukprot:6546945-Prymnesium_polylepis.1